MKESPSRTPFEAHMGADPSTQQAPGSPDPSTWLYPPEGIPAPTVRADALLRRGENGWLYIDRLLHAFIPPSLNPLGQLGAMANTSLIVAVLSGILLLVWYSPSVHHAYESLETIRTSSWLGQMLRSLHRYSADGCILFVLLHAARIACQRRFTGPRWLAWTSGLLLLSLLWFIGWTGYWLVWDVRGQHAALGTARFIDQLPILAEPLSRSFLTDQSVPSLLFFLIFFVHMLAPLAVGIGIWMHLMRVNRATFLTGRTMTVWLIGSLCVLSALLPAFSASPAQMTVKAQRFTIDWWYLWPLMLTDRLSGGALWLSFLSLGILTFTVPWSMAKRRIHPPSQAQVDLPRCMGCTLCAQDCPFNAITMVAREDGRKFAFQSHVNPDLCVGCGICVGSCDSQAINLPALNSRDLEKQLHLWIDSQKVRGIRPFVAFCCAESASSVLRTDAEGNSAELPGYRVQTVPCVGWVSAVILERALQRGAEGVLVVGCGEGDPVAREGMKWFAHRSDGRREPKVDPTKADPNRVRFVQFDRTRRAELLESARALQGHSASGSAVTARSRIAKSAAAVALAVALGGVTFLFSNLPYRTPHSSRPELIVSFNHSGAILSARQLTQEERAGRLPHMRAQVNVTRERAPVRLRVQVDGRTLLDQSYKPKGLAHDGPSMTVSRLPLSPGSHQLRIELADTLDQQAWTKQWTQVVEFQDNHNRVVLFDTQSGFVLY